MNVNRKDFYFIWVKLKNRKAKLMQRVKVSLAKYVDMFRHDCSYNIRYILTNTKPHIFRIPKNKNILNTPSRCSSFSFSIKAISNLNCLQGEVRKMKDIKFWVSNMSRTYIRDSLKPANLVSILTYQNHFNFSVIQ